MQPLEGKKALALVGPDYEDLELWYPILRFEEAGARVTLVGEQADVTYAGKHGYPCRADTTLDRIAEDEFDLLLIPGGWMPDKLRRNQDVLHVTRAFADTGRLIASICHGPWIMISAGVVAGYTMTSTLGIKDDLRNAGANWVDQPTVVDRNIITARRPPDLPQFCAAILGWYAEK